MAGRKRIAAALLRRAAAVIETYGWIRGAAGDEYRGFCTIGGIYRAQKDVATANFYDRNMAYNAMKVTVGLPVTGNIATWNDHSAKSNAEVVKAMRKAASALEHGLKV